MSTNVNSTTTMLLDIYLEKIHCKKEDDAGSGEEIFGNIYFKTNDK